MLLFICKFFITNIVFSVILCSLFTRFNESGRYSNSELLLYSLGLGPVFTTLLLYYSFLILPHRTNMFYLILIAAVYFLIAVIGRKYLRSIFCDVRNNMNKIFAVKGSAFSKIEHITLMVIICVPLIVFSVVYLTKILSQPLIGHDVLSYGVQGRILFDEKSLAPIWVTTFASSGFIYVTLHAPSFPLLLTWEELMNSLFQTKSDLYFRSINAYYGLLILGIQYYWVAKQNKWLAVLAVFALLSVPQFFISFLQPHLDLYRIFFLSISFVCLAYAVKKKDFLSLLMLGIFSGFTAFAHRIGVVMTVINCIVFLITVDSDFKTRIKKTVILVLLILAFGGVHYIFDLILGRGAWLTGNTGN